MFSRSRLQSGFAKCAPWIFQCRRFQSSSSVGHDLERGTLVTVRVGSSGRVFHGLFDAETKLKQKARLIQTNGRLTPVHLDDILFAVPQRQWFNSKASTVAIDSQRDLKQYLIFADAFIRRQQVLGSQRAADLAKIHDRAIRRGNFVLTVEQAAELCFGSDVNALHHLAALNYMLDNPLLFIPERYLDETTRFVCRHPDEIAAYRTLIASFTPNNSNELKRILDKFKRILKSQQLEKLSAKEMEYLSCIDRYARNPFAFSHRHPDRIISSHILSSVYYSVDEMGAKKLMQDLGIWRPWQFTPALTWLSGSVDLYRNDKYKKEKVIHLERIRHNDELESIRYDFSATIPAFTIDEETAHEIDDAVSLENDPTDPKSPWIHVHVADPTAHISHESKLGQEAVRKTCNIYFAEETHTLFPDQLVQEKMSLAPNRSNNTLSVSFKVNENGSIGEWKVRAGRVQNIKAITYDQVDELLQDRLSYSPFIPRNLTHDWRIESKLLSPKGSQESDSRQKNIVSTANQLESYRATFTQLEDIIGRHFLYRARNGACTGIMPKPSVLLWNEPLAAMPSLSDRPMTFHQTPPVVHLYPSQTNTSMSRLMVAECMIIAGNIIARFSSESKVPIVYRTQPNLHKVESDRHQIEAIMNTAQNGMLTIPESIKLFPLLSPSVLSTSAEKHSMLAFDSYCQATSPLRRASDLITHWQVKAALLQQAGKQKRVPFSQEQLKSLLPEIRHREREIKSLQRENATHWITMFLRQRFEYQRNSGVSLRMPPMQAYVFDMTSDGTAYLAFIKDICYRVPIRKYLMTGTLHVGSWIPVDVVSIENGEPLIGPVA